ncbi:hypothetical protein [Streptomyces thermolilacinus]|uniref:Uncharacterized protein n=1 Tax=Streptomyces thermolilacinus SPC6 TaxID=1306406 RepID=A0A1D3DXJ2_9ACTN|nr:hypothetical protein [Streptomyces thermolilacinus]OEJ97043.1 hypothetical protein J116_023975 [Streptomyces thermolilacinus SPC6]
MHRPTGEPAHTAPPGQHHIDARHIDPRVLAALLHRNGWHRTGGNRGPYTRWTPPDPGATPTSLLVPTSRAFPDSDDLLAEALAALTRTTTPSARDILAALATPSDEIRWHRATAPVTHLHGQTPWAAQDQLRTAARQVLLAAAHTLHGHHALVDHVLVTTPPDAARALTAHVPVDPGRPVTERLHHALHATRAAVDYQRATGRPDAFDTAVATGAGPELTEALVALVHGTEGATITLAWAPATRAPTGCATRPEPVEFTPGDLPALRQAGARYRRALPSVAAQVTGTVVRLRRPGPHGPGTVRLRVLTGADAPHLRVTLDEDAYRVAVRAHVEGLPLRVSGRLESRGGHRRLTDTHDVAVVQVDDAERDRLLKTLDEER